MNAVANRMDRLRSFLKDSIRKTVDFSQTEQGLGRPPPPVQKPPRPDARRIRLAAPGRWEGIAPVTVEEAIRRRMSVRQYAAEPLTLDELSFLLWATQGVRRRLSPAVTLRTVPSAGARHALETYVFALRVTGLDQALHRYLPLDHELVLERAVTDVEDALAAATFGQSFVAEAAAVFVWTAVPRRMEWRYGAAAHKVIALDAGHVAQNLYLACEAVRAGTCAIAAYDQESLDALLGVDGREEFAIYLAPVGRRKA